MNQSLSLRKVEHDLYARGTTGTLYVHKRIPAAIKLAYPLKKTHITRSLKTSDRQVARRAALLVLAEIKAEFDSAQSRIELSCASKAPVYVTRLNVGQLKGVLDFWTRQVMLADDQIRKVTLDQRSAALSTASAEVMSTGALDDDEFDELLEHLTSQRKEFGRMLAMGQVEPFASGLAHFMLLCGIHFNPPLADLLDASRLFLVRVIQVLDWRLQRMDGLPVVTDDIAPEVPHPLYLVAPERAPKSSQIATWDSVFANWRDHVKDRPKSTSIANLTAWRDLRTFVELNRGVAPSDVTRELMKAFVEDMSTRIAVTTLNDRLEMIRKIFRKACNDGLLKENPAEHIDGKQLSNAEARNRKKKRLPFSLADLEAIFSSQVYREHRRSRGQCGESTYWIPAIMYFTGARPEEVAGLALADLQQDAHGTWFFDILDRYSSEDSGLFDAEEIPSTHCRTLKNEASRRKIPVARELIDLGLLRYVEFVRQSGANVFFSSLRPDGVGKLSGAFVKVFSRIKKRELGMNDGRKVLYSFRHTMKDLLEAAEVPPKALRRILGHTMGDGTVTDGYGSDLAFENIARHFAKVKFPPIPALPWEPSRGDLSLKQRSRV